MSNADLPRLLYVSNVPVESSYHGSALLYRLLCDYPPDRLLVVESSDYLSEPSRRLSGVRYAAFHEGIERLTRTRFGALYSTFRFLRARYWQKRLAPLVQSFAPEAVLTVSHAHLWVTAAAFARKRHLPLHLICHDEITRTVMHLPVLRPLIERRFGEVYRSAASRLCVSPYMRDDYRKRFGAEAEVLYPSRAADVPLFDAPPAHLGGQIHGLRVAFAGTINSGGHMELLRHMAAALETQGGRLLLYGPITPASAESNGLSRPNVELRGMVPSAQLITTLRSEADVLFVPMSFDAQDRHAMRTNFPSKLTDYTATGLPLLIQGPLDCSAVVWARENYPVAEVVTTAAVPDMLPVLTNLRDDDGLRQTLGRAALSVGRTFFNAARAGQLFRRSLMAAEPVLR